MNEEKLKILLFALDQFKMEGFYKTTMDELAKQLRMSKKTIYKHFPKKEDIVLETINYFKMYNQKNINEIVEQNFNAVEKFYKISTYVGEMLTKINDKWFTDLQTHTPELWEQFESFRMSMMNKVLTKILEQGKNEGFIIDAPSPIVLAMLLSSIRGIVNPQFIMNNNYSMHFALKNTIDILMNGIVNAKGKKILEKLKSGADK